MERRQRIRATKSPAMAKVAAVLVAGVVACLLLGPVGAQPLPVPEFPVANGATAPMPGTLADSLVRHPQCRERTNGCELCVRGDSGGIDCSTPGIACQPESWHCRPRSEDNSASETK